MVKKVILLVSLTIFLIADFNSSCVKCHQEKKVSLRKTFMNALLVYGGKDNFKAGLFFYCKNPNPESSVMDEDFIKKFLPLQPVQIDDEMLLKLIDEYWEKYKIQGKLK